MLLIDEEEPAEPEGTEVPTIEIQIQEEQDQKRMEFLAKHPNLKRPPRSQGSRIKVCTLCALLSIWSIWRQSDCSHHLQCKTVYRNLGSFERELDAQEIAKREEMLNKTPTQESPKDRSPSHKTRKPSLCPPILEKATEKYQRKMKVVLHLCIC